MKLQVTQENFNQALNNVARIANQRSTLPILSNIMLKTSQNQLAVSATNLDIAITSFVGSKIEKEGSITIPARLTQEFISSLPPGTINLELENNKLHISSGKFDSTINGIATDEFPVMPTITGGQKKKFPAAELKKGLNQVVFAASNDETRPVLTGVYLHSDGGKLYAAATDSYRLAEKTLGEDKGETRLLIPATAISELLRIIGENEEEIQITYDEQQILFQTGGAELSSRLIEGNYPDYQKLIPNSFATTATLKRNDFLSITKVSSLFARESAGSVTIKVSGKDAQVSISSIASQLGENTASADAKIKGESEITVNSRYLIDALQALTSEEVTFGFNGKLDPSVLREAEAKTDYTHIIMPLKS